MTHLKINLKTVSVNLGPGLVLSECQIVTWWPRVAGADLRRM